MAVNGLFTFEDLYSGQSPNYYRRPYPDIPNSTTVISTEVESNTKLNKLADAIPFIYFYWILVVLAILLIITLVIVFVCYCRTFVKNYRARSRQSSSFFRRPTANSRIYTSNIYQPPAKPVAVAAPASPPAPRILPTPPCPSKSLKCLDDQLYRQDSDSTNSPPVVRHDVFLKEPLR